MPKHYAADLDVRVQVCELADSLTQTPNFTVGDAANRSLQHSAKAFANSRFLTERPLPCLNYSGPLHYLGHRANLPFRLVAAESIRRPDEDFPTPLQTPSIIDAALPDRKAFFVTVNFPYKSIKRILPRTFGGKPSLKIEAFHNGHLSAVVVVPSKALNDSPTTNIQLSGRRIAGLQEKAWILSVVPAPADAEPTKTRRLRAHARWAAISSALKAEAERRGCNEHGYRQPTGDFITSLASMDMPEIISSYDSSADLTWAALDIVISVGSSQRVASNTPFLTAPMPFPETVGFGNGHGSYSSGCLVDDGGAEILSRLGLFGTVDARPLTPPLGPRAVLPHTPTPRSSSCINPKSQQIIKASPTIRSSLRQHSTVRRVILCLGQRRIVDRLLKTPYQIPEYAGRLIAREKPTSTFGHIKGTLTEKLGHRRTQSSNSSLGSAKTDVSTPLDSFPSSATSSPLDYMKNRSSAIPKTSAFPKLHGTAREGRSSPLSKSTRVEDDLQAARGILQESHSETDCAAEHEQIHILAPGLPHHIVEPSPPTRKPVLQQPKNPHKRVKYTNNDGMNGGIVSAKQAQLDSPEPASKPKESDEAQVKRSNHVGDTSTLAPSIALTAEQREKLAFTTPGLSQGCVLSYVDGLDGETLGVRQVTRERHGWFNEEEFVLGVRYILPPGCGSVE